jgi:hypothetical protein
LEKPLYDSPTAVFTLYCDDSGTHPKSDVAVAACYVSTPEQWNECTRNWNEANQRENFGVFHMTEFVARRGQFEAPEWHEKVKRDRTIKALINIIKTRARIGFAAVVAKAAYDDVILNSPLRKKLQNNHYAFCIRLCTAMVNRWRDEHHYEESVQYVFDRVSEGRGEIDAMFRILVSGGDDAMGRYGVYKDCWSFEDKAEVKPLQAADIWAWENYWHAVNCFFPKEAGAPSKPVRRSYLALRDAPCVVKYHVRASLEQFVKEASDSMNPVVGVG